MFFKKKEEEEFPTYQVNEDFTSGNEVDWDKVIDNSFKENKSKKKSRKKQKGVVQENTIDYNFDEEKPKLRINTKIFVGVLIYICFVGLGAFLTTYTSNNIPQVINVELREKRAEIKKIENTYEDISNIITQIDKINDTLKTSSVNDSFEFATEYGKLATIASDNKKTLEGTSYNDKYVFMQKIASNIYQNLYQYLTLMSNGMSAQSGTYINQAQEYKQKYQNQFVKYTTNLEQFKEAAEIEDSKTIEQEDTISN